MSNIHTNCISVVLGSAVTCVSILFNQPEPADTEKDSSKDDKREIGEGDGEDEDEGEGWVAAGSR